MRKKMKRESLRMILSILIELDGRLRGLIDGEVGLAG